MNRCLWNLYNKIKVLSLCLMSVLLLTAFTIENNLSPKNLKQEDRCAACGMKILKSPGPHAQIIFNNNGKISHKFYDNLIEASDILQHDDSVVAIYVQPMGTKSLDQMKEASNWLNAQEAYFVVDSNQKFVMGYGFYPFKEISKAKQFQKKHGGKILNYMQFYAYLKNKLPHVIASNNTMPDMNMFMFKAMPMYMNMRGARSGTSDVSIPSSNMMVPNSMNMYQMMLMAMYETHDWSIMLMSSYNINNMNMTMNMMGKSVSFNMQSQGFGDTQLIGGYNVINDNNQKFEVKTGVSLPSGRINFHGNMPMMGDVPYGYPMQLGSGTFDPVLELRYHYYLNVITFYAKMSTIQRLYKNYRNYQLGSRYEGNLSMSYNFGYLSTGPKIQGLYTEKTNGVATGTNSARGITYNPNDMGGEIINLSWVCTLNGSGNWQYNSIDFVFGVPVYQRLNGTQMKNTYQASINLNFMFM